MEFQPILPAAREAKPKKHRRRNEGVCLSTDVRKKLLDDGRVQRTHVMRVTVPEAGLNLAGMPFGTRVTFEAAAEARRCRIRVDPNGKWRISPSTDHKKGYLRIVIRDGMQAPTVARTDSCSKVRIRKGAIEFTVPDSASFTHNLRADADAQPDFPTFEE